jgi:two-component system, OmpR family, response regulator
VEQPAVLVLLVEDDPLVRLPIEAGLEEAGFTPFIATSGSQAIAELDKGADRFKAVVTDIRLGGAPDGWEVARHARHAVSTIPVIYCSGDRASEWSEHGVPNSIMLEKPFAMAQLITALSTLLNQAIPST